MSSTKSKQLIQLAVWLLILILLNFTGSYFFKRFDLTGEKRYTLNPATIEMLKNLDDEVYVKVYLEGDFNSAFTRLKTETREMLDEFRVYAKKGLNYEFINIYDKKNKGDIEAVQRELYEKGIDPTELRTKTGKGEQVQTLFPGAVISFKTREGIWQIFNRQDGIPTEQCVNNSVQNLEYGLSNTIRKLQEVVRPRVAFIRGHHELDTNQTKDIYNALSEYYDVEYIKIKKHLKALKPYSAIILAWPDSVVGERDKFIIDQYIMNGGKVLWCLEPVYTNYDSLKLKGYTLGLNNNINLDDILFNYGIRINPALVQDMNCGYIPINRGYKGGKADLQMFPWIYKPLVTAQGNHPIVKNLGLVRFEFAGYMDTIRAEGVKKTILLSSSKNSRVQSVPARVSLGMVGTQLNEKQFTNGNKPLAILLEGTFKSNYQNRLTDTIANDSAIGFKEKSKKTAMIVISDGDIIKNDFSYSTMSISPLGYDRYMKQQFANKTFLLNCMNYLIDGPELMSVRSREVKLRLLDRKKIGLDNPLKWKLYNVLFPLVILAASGAVLSGIRRKKFTSHDQKK